MELQFNFNARVYTIGHKKKEAPLPFLEERSSLKLYHISTKKLVIVIFIRLKNREQRREMISI